jgi:hypothetical protein
MRAGETLGMTDMSASWTITNARDDTTLERPAARRLSGRARHRHRHEDSAPRRNSPIDVAVHHRTIRDDFSPLTAVLTRLQSGRRWRTPTCAAAWNAAASVPGAMAPVRRDGRRRLAAVGAQDRATARAAGLPRPATDPAPHRRASPRAATRRAGQRFRDARRPRARRLRRRCGPLALSRPRQVASQADDRRDRGLSPARPGNGPSSPPDERHQKAIGDAVAVVVTQLLQAA